MELKMTLFARFADSQVINRRCTILMTRMAGVLGKYDMRCLLQSSGWKMLLC
jgi:hypothetical protein